MNPVSFLNNIPQELKDYPYWVVSAVNKVPHHPVTRQRISPTDKEEFTYNQAIGALDGELPYAGIRLFKESEIIVIDLDNKNNDPLVDKNYRENILPLFETVTYTERSVNGYGYHIYLYGKLPENVSKKIGNIEIYGEKRYIIVTGNALDNSPNFISYQQEELLGFLETHKFYNNPLVITCETESSLTDDEVIAKCKDGDSAQLFTDLWEGRWQDYPEYPSQSEADQAFFNILATHSKDEGQLTAIYYKSGLDRSGDPKKPNLRTYLHRTIQKAFDEVRVESPSLTDDQVEAHLRYLEEAVKSQNEDEDFRVALSEIVLDFNNYPPKTRELLIAMLNNSAVPCPNYILPAGLTVLASIFGRQYRIHGFGGNIFSVLCGPTGGGKTSSTDCMSELCAVTAAYELQKHKVPFTQRLDSNGRWQIKTGISAEADFDGMLYEKMGRFNRKYTSAAAILEAINDNCFLQGVVITSEAHDTIYAKYHKDLQSSVKDRNSLSISVCITELYSANHRKGVYKPQNYVAASRAKGSGNYPALRSPCMNLYVDIQTENLEKCFTTDFFSGGFGSRQSLFLLTEEESFKYELVDEPQPYPPKVIEQVCEALEFSCVGDTTKDFTKSFIEIKFDEETKLLVKKTLQDIREERRRLLNVEDYILKSKKELLTRLHQKIRAIAGNIAAYENPACPVITKGIYTIAKCIAYWNDLNFIHVLSRSATYSIGDTDSAVSVMLNHLMKCVVKGRKSEDASAVKRANNFVVPKSYNAVTKDGINPGGVPKIIKTAKLRTEAIKELESCGLIFVYPAITATRKAEGANSLKKRLAVGIPESSTGEYYRLNMKEVIDYCKGKKIVLPQGMSKLLSDLKRLNK